MSVAAWFGMAARRAPGPSRNVLSPLQARWLGALVIAAQLPQAPHLPIWVAVTGVMLVGVRIVLLRPDPLRPQAAPARIPSWALALFAVAAAVAVRQSFGYLVGRDPSVAFLYILVAIKYLETRTTRDGTLLVCLACFLSMTPFFYSQSLFAALAALPVVLLVGLSLEILTGAGHAEGRPFEPRLALRRSAVMILQGAPIALLLFVLFPRLATPLWGLPSDYGAQSGLSDSMRPGQIIELTLSDAVACRVEFEDAPPTPRERYWRGPVFSRFDGNTWTPGAAGLPGTVAPLAGRTTTYTVTLESNNRRSLFALDMPASLPALSSGSGNTSFTPRITSDQQILSVAPIGQSLRYTQKSVLRSTYPSTTRTDARANLGLGEGNRRTIEFARELRATQPDDQSYVRALLTKFNKESYFYTLAPPLYERDPVDEFLFEGRRGFCEHYASAFVLLLRAAGIPARVVTGYQGGRMNGDYMIVRQSDAHAWAEALIDGQWQRLDPTAAVAPSRVEVGVGGALGVGEPLPFLARLDGSWLTGVRLAWDAFNYDWRRNIVGFNRDRQRLLWREWNLDQMALWQAVALIALFLAGWAGLVIGWLMWKRRHQERALVLWDDLNRRLARAGLPRHPHEGPLAFSERAARRWPQFAIAFAAIGESFAELRYGAVSVARERTALVATLERAIEVLPAPATLRTTLITHRRS
jgi:transglutaminase-like putative cysteine protease